MALVASITSYRLLPRCFPLCTPIQCRRYALSRFPNRATGFGRISRNNPLRRPQSELGLEDHSSTSSESSEYKGNPSADDSQHWKRAMRSTADGEAGLKRLLLDNDELVITRQLEMLNIFMGFEQSNRYVMTNSAGEALGYIVEEPRGLFSMFARQVFRTHRPFRALVMDTTGSPILWIRRPFSWINSRMFVQRPNHLASAPAEELVPVTFAEVQQEWHLWRRKYDLFLRSTHRILTPLDSVQPEDTISEDRFNQFARIDEGLWAWYFVLRDAQGEGVATVNRAFRGFGREIFTDTGQYVVSFRAPDEQVHVSSENNGQMLHKPGVAKTLTLDERALVLAVAINIDYDYFSRHSEGGHGLGFWWNSGE